MQDKVDKKELFLATLNNIAQVYLYLNDTTKAILTLKKAFLFSAKTDDKAVKGSLLHNIGLLSYQNGDISGIQTMKKALEI